MTLLISACEKQKAEEPGKFCGLEDGTYTAEFITDSSMFKVNDTKDNKGVLTVKDGKASIYVVLKAKGIVNLYAGTKDKAENDKDNWLQPTTETVKYDDGTSDEAYGFTVPVPALDEEFDCAILGKKGAWYDHKVSVKNPVPEK